MANYRNYSYTYYEIVIPLSIFGKKYISIQQHREMHFSINRLLRLQMAALSMYTVPETRSARCPRAGFTIADVRFEDIGIISGCLLF